MKDQKEI
jgi:hypothetical protein